MSPVERARRNVLELLRAARRPKARVERRSDEDYDDKSFAFAVDLGAGNEVVLIEVDGVSLSKSRVRPVWIDDTMFSWGEAVDFLRASRVAAVDEVACARADG